MDDNLFIRLSSYRPRPDRNPLEDFATEGLAYLLNSDEKLLNDYLDFILGINGDEKPCRKHLRVKTQFFLKGCGRIIDLAIFWREDHKDHSLFIEHKVNSLPWGEAESSDSTVRPENQVTAYCDYQKNRTRGTHDVALVTRTLLQGYGKADRNEMVYCGNFTWSRIARVLEENVKNSSVLNLIKKDYINFIRRKIMTFENFSITELSSIASNKKYEEKLEKLKMILSKFDFSSECNKEFFKERLEKDTVEDANGHWGFLFKSKGSVTINSPFWAFWGISTLNPDGIDGEKNDWFPDLLLKEDSIPDIESMVMMDLAKIEEKDRKGFDDRIKQYLEAVNFESPEINPAWDSLVLVKRKPLKSFLHDEDQETQILDFLKEGYNEITDPKNRIYNIIDEYLKVAKI